MNKLLIVCLTFLLVLPQLSFSQHEEKEVHDLVQQFFDVIGKNDSVGYKKLFLKDGYRYTVNQKDDSIYTAGKSAFDRISFNTNNQWKEVMREKGVKIEIHDRIAMAWVPYDFWVNGKLSHCGVDVFTLMKTQQDWKIAVIAYSIERGGCKDW